MVMRQNPRGEWFGAPSLRAGPKSRVAPRTYRAEAEFARIAIGHAGAKRVPQPPPAGPAYSAKAV